MIAKMRLTTRIAHHTSPSRREMIHPITGMKLKMTCRTPAANSPIATVMPQLRASLPSTFVLAPRSLKMSHRMSGTMKDRMLPRWANEAHCLSSASVSGAAGCGWAGCAGSVIVVVPFSETDSCGSTLTVAPPARGCNDPSGESAVVLAVTRPECQTPGASGSLAEGGAHGFGTEPRRSARHRAGLRLDEGAGRLEVDRGAARVRGV